MCFCEALRRDLRGLRRGFRPRVRSLRASEDT